MGREGYEWGSIHSFPGERRGQGTPTESQSPTLSVRYWAEQLGFTQLFINHPATKARFDRLLPFQVFAGWNGISVLSPTPFLPPYSIRFRRGATAPHGSQLTSADLECQQSESSFISWDFWKYGFGRVQVVPGVHACYGKEDAMLRGWVEFPDEGEGSEEAITWEDQ